MFEIRVHVHVGVFSLGLSAKVLAVNKKYCEISTITILVTILCKTESPEV